MGGMASGDSRWRGRSNDVEAVAGQFVAPTLKALRDRTINDRQPVRGTKGIACLSGHEPAESLHD
jgi:hypothetical protein